MSPQDKQLRNLARVERYRTLRNWALGLGVVAFLMSLAVIFAVPFTSARGDGPWRWWVMSLMSAAFALVVVGNVLHGLSRRRYGEV